MLPYYDVNRSSVQIIGPALWSSPSSGSGSVSGAWYAAPDSSTRQNFLIRTTWQNMPRGHGPSLIWPSMRPQSLGLLSGPRGADVAALTQPAGFVGADGWIGFSPDGQVRRGLAVFRIERGGPALVRASAAIIWSSPAPDRPG